MHACTLEYRVPVITASVGVASLLLPGVGRISDIRENLLGGWMEMQNSGELVSGQDSRNSNVSDIKPAL